MGMKPSHKKTKNLGFHETLFVELQVEDEYNYKKKYLQMKRKY